MSKITNEDLTRSGTGCFIAVQCTCTHYGNSGRLKVNYNFVAFLRSVMQLFILERRTNPCVYGNCRTARRSYEN